MKVFAVVSFVVCVAIAVVGVVLTTSGPSDGPKLPFGAGADAGL